MNFIQLFYFFFIFVDFFIFFSSFYPIVSLKGIRPELKLKTADGATLIDTDPLNLILCLTEENMIFSEILDWKLPSLSNRYLEACSEYKCGMFILTFFLCVQNYI